MSGYIVYRRDDGQTSFQAQAVVGPSQLDYLDSTAVTLKAYVYVVTAFNDDGEGLPSDSALWPGLSRCTLIWVIWNGGVPSAEVHPECVGPMHAAPSVNLG